VEQSRLIILFQALPKKYHNDISKAIHSPFFNQKAEVTALWDWLLLQKNNIFDKNKAFEALFPSQSYQADKVNAAMNKLLSLIERVLLFLEKEENEVSQNVALMRLYRNLGLEGHYETAQKQFEVTASKSGKKDSFFYQNAYQFEVEQYLFKASNRTTELNLQALNDSLDVAFMVEKLRQNCNLLSHQAVYRKEYDTGLLEQVLQQIQTKSNSLNNNTLRIYYYCYLSLKNPNETHFFEQFKTDLFVFDTLFKESDIRDLYLLAINYCIKKNNSGEAHFAKQGLQFYKIGLEKGFLLENNTLSRFSYHNIVAWALLEKDFDWTAQFINDYKNRLERTYRDSMYSFCLAKLEYSRKNHQAAMLLLQKAEYRDILLALAAKTILIKIYYELDEYDALEAHLSSMRTYITNYLNIINYIQKIIYIGDNRTKAFALSESIKAESILTEKEWLLSIMNG
jgi:hypothetical protein